MKKFIIGTLISMSVLGTTAYAQEKVGAVDTVIEITQGAYDSLVAELNTYKDGFTKQKKEMEDANALMEEFKEYLETVDISEYKPMTEEELNELIK